MRMMYFLDIVLSNNIKLYVKGDQAYKFITTICYDLFRIVSHLTLCAM